MNSLVICKILVKFYWYNSQNLIKLILLKNEYQLLLQDRFLFPKMTCQRWGLEVVGKQVKGVIKHRLQL